MKQSQLSMDRMSGWVLACGLAEAAGIAGVATVYAAVDRGLVANHVLPILAAGAWEGLLLGAMQGRFLRQFGIVPLRWTGMTMLGAVFGYGLSLLGGAGQGGETQAEPSLAIMALLGVAMGIGMGALMGALQALAGRGHLGPGRWILANIGGWALAMPAIMLGAGSVDASFTLGAIALVGAASGGIAGIALALVTGLALPA